jgi:hypothetical protein
MISESDSFSSSYDCEQERISLWNNNSSRFSEPTYVQTKQGKYDHISVQNNSVFRRCIRGNHRACNGFITAEEYRVRCSCVCHSIAEGLSTMAAAHSNSNIFGLRKQLVLELQSSFFGLWPGYVFTAMIIKTVRCVLSPDLTKN